MSDASYDENQKKSYPKKKKEYKKTPTEKDKKDKKDKKKVIRSIKKEKKKSPSSSAEHPNSASSNFLKTIIPERQRQSKFKINKKFHQSKNVSACITQMVENIIKNELVKSFSNS